MIHLLFRLISIILILILPERTMTAQDTSALPANSNGLQKELEEAKLREQISEANKKTAINEAEVLKQRLSNLPVSELKGEVALGDSAGKAEATLLGTVAINAVAQKMISQLENSEVKGLKTIVLVHEEDVPDFTALDMFIAQYEKLEKAFIGLTTKAATFDSDEGFESLSTVVTVSMQAISSIASLVQADYKIKNIEIDSDNWMLQNALASQISMLSKYDLIMPEIYLPESPEATNLISDKLLKVYEWQNELSVTKEKITKFIKNTSNDGEESDTTQKTEAQRVLSTTESLEKVINDWLIALHTVDEFDNIPYLKILYLNKLRNILSKPDTGLFIYRLHNVSGSTYTKKNLWTAFGGMPFFVMGGATGSFVLLKGDSGQLIHSALVPFHGGYKKVSQIKNEINSSKLKTVE